MDVRLTASVTLDGVTHGPNWPLRGLTQAQAESLIADRVAVRLEPATPSRDKPADEAQMIAEIIDAMGALPYEEGGDGKPNVTALGKVLGWRPSAKERDAALEFLKDLLNGAA